MNQLQTVLDALPADQTEAIAIVKQMMQAEPVAWETFAIKFANGRQLYFDEPNDLPSFIGKRPLYAAPKAVPSSTEPVAWRVWSPDGTNVYQYTEDGDGEPLFVAPKGAA